jgi:hypothetical protein
MRPACEADIPHSGPMTASDRPLRALARRISAPIAERSCRAKRRPRSIGRSRVAMRPSWRELVDSDVAATCLEPVDSDVAATCREPVYPVVPDDHGVTQATGRPTSAGRADHPVTQTTDEKPVGSGSPVALGRGARGCARNQVPRRAPAGERARRARRTRPATPPARLASRLMDSAARLMGHDRQ